jgi:hypothetical protein
LFAQAAVMLRDQQRAAKVCQRYFIALLQTEAQAPA